MGVSRFLITVLCGVLSTMAALAQDAIKPLLDTRVLIDVSGSMKTTDPGNLRRPALRLLVELLPLGSRAGVWLFSQQANSLVPLGTVDKAWKERAHRAAGRVHSLGLLTNIEEALWQATEDWREPGKDTQRHVVLLTDGMVDVSKDPRESAASRARILGKQLPRLHDLGVKIHTVALSDQVDHALLRQLSEDSGGWFEQVRSADALQRVFLRLFAQVGHPDTVPLKDNRFRVDQSIREVTLIVFRPAGASATRLITPNGAELGPETPAANVSWHQDQGYDLLTLRAPMAGEWRVRASADPDNRVLILTDLRMAVSPLPTRMVAGTGVAMQVGFENQGKPITRQELLDVLQVSAQQVGPGEIKNAWPVRDDGQGDDPMAHDGKFQFRFVPSGNAGRAELLVTAEGKTFQRESRTDFELVAMQLSGLPVPAERITTPPPSKPPPPNEPQLPKKNAAPIVGNTAMDGRGYIGVLIWFGVANLLLVIGGGLGLWLWRRRARQDPFQLVGQDDIQLLTTGASGAPAEEGP